MFFLYHFSIGRTKGASVKCCTDLRYGTWKEPEKGTVVRKRKRGEIWKTEAMEGLFNISVLVALIWKTLFKEIFERIESCLVFQLTAEDVFSAMCLSALSLLSSKCY